MLRIHLARTYSVFSPQFHQMHCLDVLRKKAFADHPGMSPAPYSAYGHLHLSHCLDKLLQDIMCSASTDVHTLGWMETAPKPWPDFGINRQCRDFNALLQYSESRGVDMDKFNNMPVPKNAYLWPAPWLHPEAGEMGMKLEPQAIAHHEAVQHNH